VKKNVNRQKCELANIPAVEPADLKTRCVTVLVFEEAGKTILQPLGAGPEAQRIQELFQNNTLEVWLPNGQSDPAQFDIAILKYKQQLQQSKMCSKTKNRVCLKNHFETIVSCEQCPMRDEGAED
jgi:hypothetical protein